MSFTSNTELTESKTSKPLNAARVEIAKGAITREQSHASEIIILVLEGTWRFHLEERVVLLKKDAVLRIAAHERYSAEAVTDIIALRITAVPHENQHLALAHDDPDQYLWGV